MGESPFCACCDPNPATAAAFIRRGNRVTRLIDESHCGVSLLTCSNPACAHPYLTIFCEVIDWADGDDPQVWIAAPVSPREFAALAALTLPATEEDVLRIVRTPRRFLVRSMPKGTPETLEWRTQPLYIPAHD